MRGVSGQWRRGDVGEYMDIEVASLCLGVPSALSFVLGQDRLGVRPLDRSLLVIPSPNGTFVGHCWSQVDDATRSTISLPPPATSSDMGANVITITLLEIVLGIFYQLTRRLFCHIIQDPLTRSLKRPG